jgi:hypothetical protein
MTTTGKPTVVELLTNVMRDVQAVGKDGRNLEQGYMFRGVDAVVKAVGPKLREHGVLVLPMLEKASYRDVQTSRGKPSRESTVEVRYRFYGPAGDFIDAVVPGEAMDFGDKGVAKAMSVAYRIVLLQALCIPTDEPEPDAATYERAQEQWDSATPARRPVSPSAADGMRVAAVEVRDKTLDPAADFAAIQGIYRGAKDRDLLTVMVPNEHGDEEALGALIIRIGKERQ